MAVTTTGQKTQASSKKKVVGAPSVTFDLATVLGVTGAFAVIIAAMVLGGSPGSFVDIPAILIVFGGTFLVTTASFTFEEVIRAQGVMLRAVIYHAETPVDAARRALFLADRARRIGPLNLEEAARDLRPSRFLRLALQLIADQLPSTEVERILTHERQATLERHTRSAGVLRRAAEVAPAMGLIGTLVGLVQMLGNLDDPSTIGPSMAVALLTTFYGAVMANMVFHPLASKLERNSDVEALVNQIYQMAALSIGRQENPRRLEVMINTVLSPHHRVSYFD